MRGGREREREREGERGTKNLMLWTTQIMTSKCIAHSLNNCTPTLVELLYHK